MTTTSADTPTTMTSKDPQTDELIAITQQALESLKGEAITQIDVRQLTPLTDTMVICSAQTNRHLKSLAERVVKDVKASPYSVRSQNGHADTGWIVIDLNGVIVHVMTPQMREFYELEKLWDQ